MGRPSPNDDLAAAAAIGLPATVQGDLFEVQLQRKNIHGQYDLIGTLKQYVATGREIEFPFAYTYTAADAAAGKVTFRVVANLPFPDLDSNPAGNERTAETTKVRPNAGRAV